MSDDRRSRMHETLGITPTDVPVDKLTPEDQEKAAKVCFHLLLELIVTAEVVTPTQVASACEAYLALYKKYSKPGEVMEKLQVALGMRCVELYDTAKAQLQAEPDASVGEFTFRSSGGSA